MGEIITYVQTANVKCQYLSVHDVLKITSQKRITIFSDFSVGRNLCLLTMSVISFFFFSLCTYNYQLSTLRARLESKTICKKILHLTFRKRKTWKKKKKVRALQTLSHQALSFCKNF